MSRARRLAANLVSVNRTNLSKLEKGASYPGLEIIAKLASAVAVDSRDTTEPWSGFPVRRCRGSLARRTT